MRPRFERSRPAAHTGRRAALATLACLAAILTAASDAIAAAGDTDLINRRSAAAGNGAANGGAAGHGLSTTGRYVAFESGADNLSGVDDNRFTNVFVRDTATGATTLASRRTKAAGGQTANGESTFQSVSGNGRFVVFKSYADNLSGSDDDRYVNLFVRDTASQTTRLVSRPRQAFPDRPGASSGFGTISANGRHVAFTTEHADRSLQVYVKNLETNRTSLASRQSASEGARKGDEWSFAPSISHDGRYIAFQSSSSNLSDIDDLSEDVFLRDTATNTTTLISRGNGPGGPGGDERSLSPSVSADGRYIAFRSDADNLSGADEDGADIFVRDRARGTTALISRRSQTAGGQAATNGSSFFPSISSNGRYIAFYSTADNLSGADDNRFGNIFVRDTAAATTTLVSRRSQRAGNQAANDHSFSSLISPNGRYVAFGSNADNLSAIDDNRYSNVFRRDVLGP